GNTYLGATRYILGEYDRAIDAMQWVADLLRGARAFEPLGVSIRPAVYARGFLAWALAEVGRFEEAETVAREGLALAEAIEHPQPLAVALLSLGTLHVKRGDVELAVEPFARARDMIQRHNLPLWKPILTSFLAYSLALTERVDEATALLNEAR